MSRFVQLERRGPAPLIGVPSLKCSQSRVMPQMPFSSRPFLGSFGRRIRWGGRITRSDCRSVLGGNRARHLAGSLDEFNAGNS